MIGKVVAAPSVYVLHINRVAPRANVSRWLSPQRSQAGVCCYLVVGVVAEFGRCVVHLASYFFEGVSSRAWVLNLCWVTLRRCF